MEAYTYVVFCIPTNQYYYGVRWGNKISPKEDLWIKYFTSSKLVKQLISEHGVDSFKTSVRKVFSSKDEAISWEESVLKRLKVLKNPSLWLNRCISKAIRYDIHPRKGLSQSESTKVKIANTLQGRTLDADVKLKMSIARKGKSINVPIGSRPHVGIANSKRTSQQKAKFQEACVNAHSKTYKLLSPFKEEIVVVNLAKFARENDFDASSILKYKKAKGWFLLEKVAC
jgi:hypothetical protein